MPEYFIKVCGAMPPICGFFLFLCDGLDPKINYSEFADEIVLLENIEPTFLDLASKYEIVELNTALKPRAFEYLFEEKGVRHAIYFDPDIQIFSPIGFLFDLLTQYSILLTPHICSPIPFDGKTPQENHFLNFGIYNLGFLGLANKLESKELLGWWKGHTYKRGRVDVYKGVFLDQLPMNFVPLFFKDATVLFHRGLNMAPWNLHERSVTKTPHGYAVNEKEPLVFYHFSSFRTRGIELPIAQYDRYQLNDLPHLREIYEHYQQDLQANGNETTSKIPFAYTNVRKQAIRSQRQQRLRNKLFFKKNRR